MNARFVVDVGNSPYQLCENALNSGDGKSSMVKQVIVKFVTCMSRRISVGIISSTSVGVPGQYSNASHTRLSVTITS